MCASCCDHDHSPTLSHELIVHLPYAIFSVAFALAVLSFTSTYKLAGDGRAACYGATVLFHCFHCMHLVFAATGTILTFLRFSSSMLKGLLIGTLSPIVFCMTSDAILPYLGGRMFGVPMKLHLCFVTDVWNVIPFLVVGIINGFVMSRHRGSVLSMYSIFSHMLHILVSALASMFYLVSYGFSDWYCYIGIVFVFIIFAVVVPCTMSDLVVPILFAKANNEHEKH